MALRVFSTCSGISAASVAWKSPDFEFVAFAEVDPFACHVLNQRCDATAPKYLPKGKSRAVYEAIKGGRVVNFGDITKITDADLEAIGPFEVLEGGTPCQGLSRSGLRLGFNDPRSALALIWARLIHDMRRINGLRYIIWENVDGVFSDKNNAFGCLLAALGSLEGRAKHPILPPEDGGWSRAGHMYAPSGSFAWRSLDAQFWGVPQRRKRVFLVGCLGTSGPDPLSILGELGSREGGSPTRRGSRTGKGKVCTPSLAEGGADGAGGVIVYNGGQGAKAATIAASQTVAPCLKAARSGSSQVPFIAEPTYLFDRQRSDFYTENGVASTLRANTSAGWDHDIVVHCKTRGRRWLVRRLMPVEAERLMGFPDDWTSVTYKGKFPPDDGPRFTALGNSIAVPCLAWIGEKMLLAQEPDYPYFETFVHAVA